MMMKAVSQDLVQEILLKLPVKSVVRFKCVSKSWYFLISNRLFIKSHLRQSCNNPMWLVFDNNGLPKTQQFESVFNNMKLKYPSILDYDSCSILSICDGLIVLNFCHSSCHLWYSKSVIADSLVMICNPCTGESLQLPMQGFRVSDLWSGVQHKFVIGVQHKFKFGFGFGYDFSTDDYKVVQLTPNEASVGKIWVTVFSLKSMRWTTVNENVNGIVGHIGTYLNGALHWGSYDLNLFKIVAFNLADEKFLELPGPAIESVYNSSSHQISVYKDCICVNKYYRSMSDGSVEFMSIWIMKEYGNPTSWTNHKVNISSLHVARNLVIPALQTEFRIWLRRDTASTEYVLYDLDEREVMIFKNYKDLTTYGFFTFLYHETLVSPYMA